MNQETITTYNINGETIDVVLCWQGKEPEDDDGRFYDIYDDEGHCLNEGEPWHDDGKGIPSVSDVRWLIENRAQL